MASRHQATWPFPGDTPVVVARKVAAAYREVLGKVAPDLQARLDDRMVSMGQAWVRPRLLAFDMDDDLDVRQAADLALVEPDSIGQWRRRGRLTGIRGADGTWRYKARDVLTAARIARTRQRADPKRVPPK